MGSKNAKFYVDFKNINLPKWHGKMHPKLVIPKNVLNLAFSKNGGFFRKNFFEGHIVTE
jgi:hypothetical protein